MTKMPEVRAVFVETFEPTHPFRVKAVAEIPMDGAAPAVGVNVDENPITPEKVWKAMKLK